MVGTEFLLVIIGVVLWLAFHILQMSIEKRELDADEEASKNPERVKRVFSKEAEHY